MMYKLLLIALLGTFTASAQKQTYLLVAYCQKQINGICGEKVMVQQDEVSLLPAESITYRNKMLTEMRATYNKGYSNFFVELVPTGKAAIVYEYEKIFTPQKDGWDCTTTSYGVVRANDLLAAEKSFAALQAEYKRSTFKEVRRWGKAAILTPAAVGENDVDVTWKMTANGYFLRMKNTRTDIALEITVISYKPKNGTPLPTGSAIDLSKMVKSDETTLLLEPGSTSQNSLPQATAFDIIIKPKAATPYKEGIIDKIKKVIKSYVTCPDSKCEPKPTTTLGVRG